MTASQIRDTLRKRALRAGSQKALARQMGVSLPYLNDVLRGRRDPGPKILDYLGLRVTYGRRG